MEEKFVHQDETTVITLPRSKRWTIFAILILITIFAQVDQGVFTMNIKSVKSDLNISDTEYGIFSSIFFLGKCIGSFSFIFLLKMFNRKAFMYLSCFFTAAGFLIFTTIKEKMIIYASRIILGYWNIFYIVYFPVWCDQYGMTGLKTMMITIFQISLALSVIIGSVLGTFFEWKSVLFVQSIVMFTLGVILLCFDSNYFSNTLYAEKGREKKSNLTIYSEVVNHNSHESENKKSDLSKILHLFTQKSYVLYALSRGLLFFSMTVVMTWLNDYLENVLGFSDKRQRLMMTGSVSLTAPILGTGFGGGLGTKLGGYENIKAGIACCVLYAISSAASIALPYTNTLFTFGGVFWVSIFFSSAMIPMITGIIITSVPNEVRGSANSLTSLFANLFGQVPAPYVYGAINSVYRETDNRLAMKVCMCMTLVCLFLLILSTIVKSREGKKEELKESEKSVQLKEMA